MDALLINDIPANQHGVRMGEGFIAELHKPCEMKEYVQNDSRLTDGIELIAKHPHRKERTLTLNFVIIADTPQQYADRLAWLTAWLYQGTIKITLQGEDYHLVYTGRSVSYTEGLCHTNGTLAAQFTEPIPSK